MSTKSIFDDVMALYSKWRLFLLLITLFAIFLMSFSVVGPFMASDQFLWIMELSKNNRLVKELIDVQGMAVDKVISASVPLFTVWSIALHIYDSKKLDANSINEVSKHLSVFTGGVAFVILAMGSALMGVSSYGLIEFGFAGNVIASFLLAGIVVAIGVFVRKSSSPKLKDRETLRRYAKAMAMAFAALAVSAYVYGLLADPIRLFLTLSDAYKMS